MRESLPSPGAKVRRAPSTPEPQFFSAAPEIADAAVQWLQTLAHERRASRHTLDGYARDAATFLAFLTEHLGERPDRAALVALDRSTMGNVLERLEGKRLIERRANPQDKRVKLLKLSRRGAKLLVDCEPFVQAAQARMLEPLAADERVQFTHMMRRMIARQDIA
mgnify:CR=1 FL=1